jgi:nicotinate-nucleotide pyrophosphorylase (carboxylating)
MSSYHPPLRPTPANAWEAVRAQVIPAPPSTQRAHASGAALAFPLSEHALSALVQAALHEDQAQHDVSTLATVPESLHVRAAIMARRDGVIAGTAFAEMAFRTLDPNVTVRIDAVDGTAVRAGSIVMHVAGQARALLSAERVALNFMQHLSGIATLTAQFVSRIDGTAAKILDTRKTLPGWRALEKYAVRAGGGVNHRMDLAHAVLIKDNHLAAIGGNVAAAVASARALAGAETPIQIECDTLEQVDLALAAGADSLLLDNMSLEQLRDAVTRCRGRAITEASGGVALQSVRGIAETGVDRISIGALTHSAPALDLALDFEDL